MARDELMKNITNDIAGYCACQKLRVASRKVTRMYDDAIRSVGIVPTQFTLLAVVGRSEAVTITELAENLGMERTTLSRNLKPLERDGLISVSAEGYRRSRSVQLSDKGVTVLGKALPLWKDAQATLKKQLGTDIWNQLQTDLTKVNNRL
jgi:DNA-binding MarR family transcriptional regulator